MSVRFDVDVQNHYFAFRAFPCNTARQRITGPEMTLFPEKPVSYGTDSFGNKYMYGSIIEPHSEFSINLSGQAETGLEIFEEKADVYDSKVLIYRNQSYYTRFGEALTKFHDEIAPSFSKPVYDRIYEYMNTIYENFSYEQNVTDVNTTAEEAVALKKGVCQDYAHVLLAMCRADKIPARYVVGMMTGEGASHAWIEALCNNYWYGFDPTNNLLIDDQYIKISHGRDFKDCLVNRGIFVGGGHEQKINVRVDECQ